MMNPTGSPDTAKESWPVTPVPADHRQGEYADQLITLNRMAHLLRDKRFKEGSIDFDREEPRFEIDEKGKPIRVYFKTAKDANKLVEEFMLLANRTVAESIGLEKKPKTLPYRIHDMPDINKLDNLAAMASRFGYRLTTVGKKEEVAKSLNQLLKDVHVNFDHVNQVGLMLTAPINIGNWWQNRLTFTGWPRNRRP